MKGAQEFVEELVRHVRPPRGCAIALTERTPKDADDTNWMAGAGNMPYNALTLRQCRSRTAETAPAN